MPAAPIMRWSLLAAALAAPAHAASCGGKTTAMDMVQGRDLAGQVHVITGGDSGLGYEAAVAIASRNATLILLSYDAAGHGADAAANITKATGNAAVSVLPIDLSSFASVRTTAKALVAQAPHIDVLINDAGIACVAVDVLGCVGLSRLTDDGYERVIETNYLGHFLLTELLLPTLRQSKGRVVNVASDSSNIACLWAAKGAGNGCMDNGAEDLVKTPVPLAPPSPSGAYPAGEPVNNSFHIPASYYGVSKYMMITWTAELARRESAAGSGVTAFVLHPGAVATPMYNPLHQPGVPAWVPIMMCEGHFPCPLTAAEGGATPAYIAAAPDSELAGQSGSYFTYCKKTSSVIDKRSDAATYQAKLYDNTLKWTGA